MIVYKVVSVDEYGLRSLVADGEIGCTYGIGLETKPKVGYLFAYDNYYDAMACVRKFRASGYNVRAFAAVATIAKVDDFRIARCTCPVCVKVFWGGGFCGERPPPGTVLCETITLTAGVVK